VKKRYLALLVIFMMIGSSIGGIAIFLFQLDLVDNGGGGIIIVDPPGNGGTLPPVIVIDPVLKINSYSVSSLMGTFSYSIVSDTKFMVTCISGFAPPSDGGMGGSMPLVAGLTVQLATDITYDPLLYQLQFRIQRTTNGAGETSRIAIFNQIVLYDQHDVVTNLWIDVPSGGANGLVTRIMNYLFFSVGDPAGEKHTFEIRLVELP